MKKMVLALVAVAALLNPMASQAERRGPPLRVSPEWQVENPVPHEVLILDDNDLSTQARIDVMLRAKRTIKAQYFIFGEDITSLAGLAVLALRAKELESIRLIIDGQFNGIPEDVTAYLKSLNIELKIYHPFKLTKPSWITRRMHDKGVSADGEIMIRGGRNVESSYLGFSAGRNYVDRDILVIGPVVKQSDEYFDELFNSEHVEYPKVKMTEKNIASGRAKLEAALEEARKLQNLDFRGLVDWEKFTYLARDVKFLHDPVGKKDLGDGIAQRLRDVLLNAQSTVLIETPYLVPTDEVYNHIAALKAKNPNIAIFIHTNSNTSTDGIFPAAAYLNHRQRLIDAGVKIWEYKGPQSLHSKSMVIDGKVAFIGSYNLDPRSQFLNTEIAIQVADKLIARQLTESIAKNMKNAWVLGSDGKPLEPDETYENMSRWKKTQLWFLKQIFRWDRLERQI